MFTSRVTQGNVVAAVMGHSKDGSAFGLYSKASVSGAEAGMRGGGGAAKGESGEGESRSLGETPKKSLRRWTKKIFRPPACPMCSTASCPRRVRQ
jgi:hypothetical protein